MYAKDVSSIQADFRKIAEVVRIPGWDDNDADIFTSVRDWLRNESNGPWVMILDNVDDPNVLTTRAPSLASSMRSDGLDSSSRPQIREFLTTSLKGSILVTSRNREAAQMITGYVT